MALIKAVILGAILTFVVSALIGSGGSSGGWLNVHLIALAGYQISWSWPLFVAATGLAWGILLLMD